MESDRVKARLNQADDQEEVHTQPDRKVKEDLIELDSLRQMQLGIQTELDRSVWSQMDSKTIR